MVETITLKWEQDKAAGQILWLALLLFHKYTHYTKNVFTLSGDTTGLYKITSFCIIRLPIILSEFHLWCTWSCLRVLVSDLESFRAAVLGSKCYNLFIVNATVIHVFSGNFLWSFEVFEILDITLRRSVELSTLKRSPIWYESPRKLPSTSHQWPW